MGWQRGGRCGSRLSCGGAPCGTGGRAGKSVRIRKSSCQPLPSPGKVPAFHALEVTEGTKTAPVKRSWHGFRHTVSEWWLLRKSVISNKSCKRQLQAPPPPKSSVGSRAATRRAVGSARLQNAVSHSDALQQQEKPVAPHGTRSPPPVPPRPAGTLPAPLPRRMPGLAGRGGSGGGWRQAGLRHRCRRGGPAARLRLFTKRSHVCRGCGERLRLLPGTAFASPPALAWGRRADWRQIAQEPAPRSASSVAKRKAQLSVNATRALFQPQERGGGVCAGAAAAREDLLHPWLPAE